MESAGENERERGEGRWHKRAGEERARWVRQRGVENVERVKCKHTQAHMIERYEREGIEQKEGGRRVRESW